MVIYKAENKINGMVYIGKTIRTLKYRKYRHLSDSSSNSNTYFHKAIRKYGKENFEWSILVETDSESKLNALEKFYIMIYRKMLGVYNLTEGGEGMSGYTQAEESRKKVSDSKKGKPRDEETKKKISDSHKGKIPWNKGKTIIYPEGTKNPFFGKKHSEESCKKMSDAKKGKTSSFKGKHHSAESKIKLAEQSMGNSNRKGKKHSDDAKRKMSESQRLYREKKKSGIVG